MLALLQRKGGLELMPVIEAEADDALHVRQGDLSAALQRHQGARCLVDRHVTADAVHVQQAADLAHLQLHVAAALHLRHAKFPVTRPWPSPNPGGTCMCAPHGSSYSDAVQLPSCFNRRVKPAVVVSPL